MRIGRFLGAGAAALAVISVAACGDPTSTNNGGGGAASAAPASSTAVPTCVSGSLNIDGSSAIKALVQKAADDYSAQCPGATVTVAATNSSTGVTKAASGAVDIGDSDVPASLVQGVDASKLVDHPVAIVLFAVAVNPASKVTNLTLAQVQQIFSGQVTNWSQVGGASLPISVFERTAGSGTRLTFDHDVMQGQTETSSPAQVINTTQTVVQSLAAAPGGIAYLTNSSVTASSGITAVSIDGVAPSASAVSSGTYPFFSHEHQFTGTNPSQLALSFIQFIQSSAFQGGDLTTAGYLPLSTTSKLAAVDQSSSAA
jgi:phosphate transport system substrate-binding protein